MPHGGKASILVVEDDDAVRDLIAKVFANNGYQVDQVSSSEEALKLFRSRTKPIDLLISDVIMPNINGAKLAEQLIGENQGLKVLFISGYTAENLTPDNILGTDVEFLQKPFRPTQLPKKVQEVINRNLK